MYIHAKVVPSAKKESFEQTAPDHFKISVREKAMQNLANTRVRELLALHFSLPDSKVRLISGHHSPSKIFAINIEKEWRERYNESMNINIKATNIELTDAIRSYVEKKLAATEQKLIDHPDEAIASVEVGKTTEHHRSGDVFRAEAVLTAGKEKFVAVSEKDDLYAAIDEIQDKLQEEISRKKTKRRSLFRKGGTLLKKILRKSE